MIGPIRKLRRDQSGVTVVEFALIAPALILLMIGTAQLGIMFLANAGLRNAIGEGARYATIYPRPTDAQIQSRIRTRTFGLKAANLTVAAPVHGQADGANYADLSVSYSVPLNFIFFTPPPVTLTQTRRVFVQPLV